MSILVLVLCTIATFSVHELGHAFAFRKHGILLKEICLLGMGPKLVQFRLRQWFGDTPVTIRLVPIGAFVLPADDSDAFLQALPYHSQAEIMGAGVINNILLFLVLLLTFFLTTPGITFTVAAGAAVVLAVVYAGVYFGRIILSSHVFPYLGLALVALVTVELISPHTLLTARPDAPPILGGPVTLVREIGHLYQISPLVRDSILLGSIISLSIGLGNLVPFLPFDGGQIWRYRILSWMNPEMKLKYVGWVPIGLAVPGFLLVAAVLLTDAGVVLSMFKQ